MALLVSAHSGLRWLVLLAVVATAIWALGRGREVVPDWPRWVGILVAAQVVLGLVLYLVNGGWRQGWFIAAWHPVAMIAALGAFQVGVARAREADRPRVLGGFAVLSLALMVLAIPWQRGLV